MAAVRIIDDWNVLVILQLERLSAGWQQTIVCVHVGYIYMDDWLIIGYTFYRTPPSLTTSVGGSGSCGDGSCMMKEDFLRML